MGNQRKDSRRQNAESESAVGRCRVPIPAHDRLLNLQRAAGNIAVSRLFGKSAMAIAARREVKLRVVEALTTMVEAGLGGYRLLTETEALDVSAALHAFVLSQGTPEQATLSTAKGMVGAPANTYNHEGTLWEFLVGHMTEHACGQNFSHDARLWAEQIIAHNRSNAALRRRLAGPTSAHGCRRSDGPGRYEGVVRQSGPEPAAHR